MIKITLYSDGEQMNYSANQAGAPKWITKTN